MKIPRTFMLGLLGLSAAGCFATAAYADMIVVPRPIPVPEKHNGEKNKDRGKAADSGDKSEKNSGKTNNKNHKSGKGK